MMDRRPALGPVPGTLAWADFPQHTVGTPLPEPREQVADANSSIHPEVYESDDCVSESDELAVVVLLAIVGFAIWSLGSLLLDGYWAWELAHRGATGTATVVEYQPKRVTYRSGRRAPPRTRIFHLHRVRLREDRGRVETVDLKEEHAIGAEITVLYLPDQEGIAVAGNRGDSAVRIFFGRIHGHKFLWLLLWAKLIVLGFVALCGWLFPDQAAESVSGEILNATVQAVIEVESE